MRPPSSPPRSRAKKRSRSAAVETAAPAAQAERADRPDGVAQAAGGDAVARRARVPVEVRRPETRPGSNVVSARPKRLERRVGGGAPRAAPAGGLEHEPEREVVRARVGVPGAPRAPVGDRDERAREPARRSRSSRILRVVVEPGRVREEVADRRRGRRRAGGRGRDARPGRRGAGAPASASFSASTATNVFVTLPTRNRSAGRGVAHARTRPTLGAVAQPDDDGRHTARRPARRRAARATASRVGDAAIADRRRRDPATTTSRARAQGAATRTQLGVGTTSPTSASRATSAA